MQNDIVYKFMEKAVLYTYVEDFIKENNIEDGDLCGVDEEAIYNLVETLVWSVLDDKAKGK